MINVVQNGGDERFRSMMARAGWLLVAAAMCVQMLYVTVEDPGRPAGPPCVPSPSLDDVREERMVRLSAFPNSIGQPSGWIQLDISNRQLSTGN